MHKGMWRVLGMVICALLCAGSLFAVSSACHAAQRPKKPSAEQERKAGNPGNPEITGSIVIFEDEPLVKVHINAKAQGRKASVSEVSEYRKKLKSRRDEFKSFLKAKLSKAKVGHEYDMLLNGLSVNIKPEELKKLGKLPFVKAVCPNYRWHMCLSDSVPMTGAPSLWSGGNTGQGVKVAIVDTGIDYSHPDLGGGGFPNAKVIGGYDFFNGDSNPMDDHGHGTHCASIAAGTGAASSGQYRGMASGALLYAYKVLGPDGGDEDDVLAGVNASVDPNNDGLNDDAVDIISMSLGGPGYETQMLDPVCVAIRNARDVGTVTVVAAGNYGYREYYSEIQHSPAYCPEAITVGASDKSDVIADWSMKGPTLQDRYLKPDLVAPGVGIVAARANGTTMGTPLNSYYTTASGTSMATPHVAGAAALVIHDHPTYTPDQVKSVLCDMAVDLGRNPWKQGGGRLQVFNAATTQTDIAPSIISFGVSSYNPTQTVTVSVHNGSGSPITYNLGTAMPAYVGVTLDLSTSTLIVPAGSTGSFTATITVDYAQAGDHPYHGAITLTTATEQIRVPFGCWRNFGPDDIWPINAGEPFTSHVTMADVDSNNQWDVIAGTQSGRVYVVDTHGNVFPGWPSAVTNSPVLAPPSAEDIDGDHQVEILAVSGGQIRAWNLDGTAATGWPYTGVSNLSTVAMADINGDNLMELFAGGGSANRVVGLHGDGTAITGWPVSTTAAVVATPGLCNMDGDRDLEVVVGDEGGNVYCLNPDGTAVTGWPKTVNGPVVASPVFADLDRDGTREVIVATEAGGVYVWEPDGTALSGWPKVITGRIWASPVAGMILGDGMDVAVLTTQGQLYVWKSDGTLAPGTPHTAAIAIPDTDTSRMQPSPLLWEFDETYGLDVVIGLTNGRIHGRTYDSSTQTWHTTWNEYTYITRILGGSMKSTPAMADTEQFMVDYFNAQDNCVELAAGSSNGLLTMWRYQHGWPPPRDCAASPWQMLGHDPWHTGRWEYLWTLPDSLYVEPSQTDLLANGMDKCNAYAALVNRWGWIVNGGTSPITYTVSTPTSSVTPTTAGYYYSSEMSPMFPEWALRTYTATLNPGDAYVTVSSPNLSSNQGEFTITVSATNPWDLPAPIASSGANPATLNIADVDGNGTKEIIAGGDAFGVLHAWKADGTGEPTGWPVSTQFPTPGRPAVGDLDLDNQVDVVTATAYGHLYVHSGNGAVMQGWPVTTAINGLPVSTGSPVLANVAGDAHPEVIACGEGWLFVYDYTGQPVSGFPKQTACDTDSGIAVGNLDGDPLAEIVCTTNIHRQLDAYNGDGTSVTGWPQVCGIWDEPMSRSPKPTLADIDGDGQLEVIYSRTGDFNVYAWNADGTSVTGWPVAVSTESYWKGNASVGDVDGDGALEVLGVCSWVDESENVMCYGVYVLNGDGTPVLGWPAGQGTDYLDVVLADVDGDSVSEIISGAGHIYAYNADGSVVQNWPVGCSSIYNPIMADIDADGALEGISADYQHIYVWSCESGSSSGPWPMPNGNPANTRCIPSGGFAPVTGEIRTATTLADLNGDGNQEAVIACSDGRVHVVQSNGAELTGWPQTLSSPVVNPAAVGDIDNDGAPEIVVAGGGSGYGGDLYAFEIDGTLVSGSWPQETTTPTTFEASSAPALGDIDGDGYLEIVVGSSTMSVSAYNHDGSACSGWPQSAMDPVCDTPALGDIDGDGALEIVAGDTTGFLWAWNGDGTRVSTWPVDSGSGVQALQLGTGSLISSPVLADLDSDGKPEIIACTQGGYAYAINEDGSFLAGWQKNLMNGIWATPAIGDVNGDKQPDVVIALMNGSIRSYSPSGTVTPGWTAPQLPLGTPNDGSYRASSPVIADVDNDDAVEVLIGCRDGNLYAFNSDGSSADGWPKVTQGPIYSTPAIGNMDGDSTWDVVIGSTDGSVYRWEVSGNTDFMPADKFPWPTFHGDNLRSGNFRIIGQDSFTRTGGTGWGIAEIGGQWTDLDVVTGASFTSIGAVIGLQNYEGWAEPNSGWSTGLFSLSPFAIDADVTAKVNIGDVAGEPGVVARASSYNTFYAAVVSFYDAELRIVKYQNGTPTVLGTLTGVPVTWLGVRIRLRVEGNTLKAKNWAAGSAEPAAWSLQVTDPSPLPAGKTGVVTGETWNMYLYDDFLAEALRR